MEKVLPKSWIVLKVKEVFVNLPTTGKKTPQKHYLEKGDYPIIDQGSAHIGGYTNDSEKLVSGEPPYIVFGDHTKVVKYVSSQFAPGADGVKALKAKEFINAKLFNSFLKIIVSKIIDKGYARHYQHLIKEKFPLPPLAEQKRIVCKIEELFSELDAGVESFKLARKQLGLYRQSLLQQVFCGKLTAQSKNSKTVRPFGELIGIIQQGWSPKCNLNRPPNVGEWAVIKTTAVQPMKYVDIEAKPLPSSFEPREHIEIQDGDFLMTRKGPRYRAGVTCYVPKTRTNSMVCDTVYRFRCHEEIVAPLYLEVALNTPQVIREIDSLKSGINESGLSLTHKKVRSVSIPVYSLSEQKEIVRILESQFTVIEQNEREIDAALKRANALRQSILKKAFSGQLVEQDPNDEPASVLLKRIQTERTEQEILAKTSKTVKNKTKRKTG